MAMQLRWVGEQDLDSVALTRLRCYARSDSELDAFKIRTRTDPRSQPGDYLLAEVDGQAVGTATSLSMTMWARGSSFACQGVAWVGAIKTMRRKGLTATPGVASAVMQEVLQQARERSDIVSALMPFRASYYEHFGYGIVERRCEWTVPIAALPAGDFNSIRFAEPHDFDAREACLRRINQSGQCQVERSPQYWKNCIEAATDGFSIVDRPGDGPVRGAMTFLHQQIDGKDWIKVSECFYEDIAGLRRQLHFLSSLKDQFWAVQLLLPADLPLNRLLKESQIPHRPVNHAVARCVPQTRMQVRILDHEKFLQGLNLPAGANGQVVIAVHECEGTVSKFKLQIEAGRLQYSTSDATAGFECSDQIWAGIACGDLKATDAVRLGLAAGSDAVKLDILAHGPLPFTHEHF